MSRALLVLVGGGVGSVVRYLTALVFAQYLTPSFPLGTLTVNVVGCFFISFVHGLAMLVGRMSPETRIFLTTGVLGGLTTYSSFNYETLVLVEQGRSVAAGVYLTLTLVGCAVAGLLGTLGAHAVVTYG